MAIIMWILFVIVVIYALIYTSSPEGSAAYEARRRAYKARNLKGGKWYAHRIAEINVWKKAAKEARLKKTSIHRVEVDCPSLLGPTITSPRVEQEIDYDTERSPSPINDIHTKTVFRLRPKKRTPKTRPIKRSNKRITKKFTESDSVKR